MYNAIMNLVFRARPGEWERLTMERPGLARAYHTGVVQSWEAIRAFRRGD